jgi:hypothetical protein
MMQPFEDQLAHDSSRAPLGPQGPHERGADGRRERAVSLRHVGRLRSPVCSFAFAASLLCAGTVYAQDAPPAAPVALPEGAPPPVRSVSLDAPPGVRLERDTTGNHDWGLVCVAPCSMDLPLASVYRVAGRGIRNSGPFALRAPEGVPERLVVKPASSALLTVGVVSLTAGGVAAFVGYIGYFVWDAGEAVASAIAYDVTGMRPQSEGPPLWIAVSLGGGALLAIVGTVLVLMNHRTGVEQASPGSEPPPRPALPPRIHAETPQPTRFPAVTLVPIFTGTF